VLPAARRVLREELERGGWCVAAHTQYRAPKAKRPSYF
jgi:hypothetical protein